MKIDSDDFCVKEGRKTKLKNWPTLIKPFYRSKEEYREFLQKNICELTELQRLYYASNRYALLLIFQGMDGSGKDGAISHVMSGINPQGCSVYNFKQPSAEELSHDFLWREACRLPERGHIGIFNRSYYEEVAVVRVHPELLRNEGFQKKDDNKDFWDNRYRSIVNFEDHLHRNKTKIVKFYLHLSQEEQKKRLIARIDKPEKNWKLSTADLQERKYWAQYIRAYEECFSATSTKHSPWYIIPADDKENARLIISQIVLYTFHEFKLSYPKITPEHEKELKIIRKQLME